MWKDYINIIKERDIDYNYQEYCLWFCGHFSYNIYSLSHCINLIEKENGDLLPISKNLIDYFYSNDIDLMISLIYHINDLKNLDFIIMNNNKDKNIDSFFSSRDSKLYFFNLFSFDNELLLSNDSNNATLLFLFFYFLPENKNQDLLYHSRKKIPLVSCNQVSLNHFKMLIFLMKEYDTISYNSLCKNHNMNLVLLEDFCINATELYTFFNHDDWYEILPIVKMTILFKENCHFSNFSDFSKNKVYYTVPTLSSFIQYFQKELEFFNLKEKLSKKWQFNKKDIVVKI